MGLLNRNTLPIFLGIVGILLVFSLITQLTITEQKRSIGSLLICFHMTFDLTILTILLALTGGFSNPFVALLLLNVGLGGLLIVGRLSYPFLVLIHFALSLLQFQWIVIDQRPPEFHLLVTFALYHFLIFFFWIIMRSLGAHLERQFERQTQTQILLEKQDRLRAIGALAAGFSHEFASPLNSAKIRLERILRRDQSEDVIEALKAVQNCEEVIHLMNVSQIDQRDFKFKTMIIRDLLKDIIESWKEEHPHIQVVTDFQESTLGSIPPVNFAQVILNLLDNAHEAAPDKNITVFLSETETNFELKVVDQGPGFPESVIRHLGEPFVTAKTNGTGLGLYVSQLFCQSLGGSLHVKSEVGNTSILLTWPKKGVNEWQKAF